MAAVYFKRMKRGAVAKTETAWLAVVEITRSVKGTAAPRAGSAPARPAANPTSGLNIAANDAAVTLLCFTIPPPYRTCRGGCFEECPPHPNITGRAQCYPASALWPY